MRFSRIRLENWRNFGEVDVQVARRVFLVGANASGKSNFLDALRFLRDLVKTGGGFQQAILERRGVKRIRNLAARRNTNVAIEVDLMHEGCHRWQYRVVFNQDNRSRPYLVEERVCDENGKPVLERPDARDCDDSALLGETHLEQVSTNREYREIADFFRTIHYSHLVPQLVRSREYYTEVRDDPFGSDFLEIVARVPARTRDARLRRIQKALSIVAPGFSEIRFLRDEYGLPHLLGKYEHWRKRGAWQEESEFSDGTLRLIGMLWALQDGMGPLLLEEPELSLHSEVVRISPQFINSILREARRRERQIFISTHSPELLHDEGIGTNEVLILNPSREGTALELALKNKGVVEMLGAKIPMSEIIPVITSPDDLTQLPFIFRERT